MFRQLRDALFGRAGAPRDDAALEPVLRAIRTALSNSDFAGAWGYARPRSAPLLRSVEGARLFIDACARGGAHADEALAYSERAVQELSRPVELLEQAARLNAHAGHFEKALAFWEEVIEVRPQWSPDALGRAQTLQMAERLDEAREAFASTAALAFDEGEHSIEAAALEGLLRLGAVDVTQAVRYARALTLDSRPREAIAFTTKVRETFTTNAHLLRWQAESLMDLERRDEALASFQAANELEPGLVSVLCGLGILHHGRREYSEASRHLEAALAADPCSSESLFNLALVRFEQDELDEALALLVQCRDLTRGKAWLDTESGESGRGVPSVDSPESIPLFKLRHDIEQLQHLRLALPESAAAFPILDRLVEKGTGLIDQADAVEDDFSLQVSLAAAFGDGERQLLNSPFSFPHSPAQPFGALNPNLDTQAFQAQFLQSDPHITFFDDFLSDEALDALRRFCATAGVWHNPKTGYLGAYMQHGFFSELLLQIAAELRQQLPDVLLDHPLQTMWAYKYDSRLGGIGTHADTAAVNVNFWITPQEACLDEAHGGLVVHTRRAPPDWSFREFNANPEATERYLNEAGHRSITVPYRENRAVVFDSDLFHRTDDFHFRGGYLNRRINITMLFGLKDSPKPGYPGTIPVG